MKLPINYNTAHCELRRHAKFEYIKLQDNKCYLCKGDLDKKPIGKIAKLPIKKSLFPPSFFKWPIHLHHDHETGLTKGAVHCHCNAVLWQYYNK